MYKNVKHLYHTSAANICRMFAVILCGAIFVNGAFAAVAQRGATNSSARVSVNRNSAAAIRTTVAAAQPVADAEPDTTSEPEPEIIIEDKSSQFSDVFSETGASNREDDALAAKVAQQRAALNARDAIEIAEQEIQSNLANGQHPCDADLRKCMREKCGDDFSKCAGDGDTDWGIKIEACRRDAQCTGTEYNTFAIEIKADRDMNAKMSRYNTILDCGTKYTQCITNKCGTTFGGCLGKSDGDAAIAECASIAKQCTQADTGLASRMGQVFGTLRQNAEVQAKKDEEQLYKLRDQMRERCVSFGAAFDERSLVCVYTVNFFAGDSDTPYASKKLYAGSRYDCTPDWFGVDVTTFKENAYRATRAQKEASSALLGAGVGTAVGAVTSGTISRAIDRQKANNAVKKAEKEHEKTFGEKAQGTRGGG